MNKKKLLSLFMVAVMSFGSLAGCGSKTEQADGKSDTSAETADISGEIRMAYWDEPQTGCLEEQIAAFNEIYPNVTVKLELTGWNDFWSMLEMAVTGGSAADVFWMNVPNFKKYADAGVLMPIDDLVEDGSLDLDDYPQGLIDAYNFDGHQYGVPKDYDATGIYYNKKIFDEYGVEYPTDDWTWEEMMEKAGQLTDPEKDLYGIALDIGQYGHYATVPAAGISLLSEDQKSWQGNTPEGILGIQSIVDVIEAGYAPTAREMEEYDRYTRFLNGNVAMITVSSNWFNTIVGHFGEETEATVGAALLPSIGGNPNDTVVHGLANCINANTENPEAAKAWVEFLSTEGGMEITAKNGLTAAMSGYDELWADSFPDSNLDCFIEAAKYADPYPGTYSTQWMDTEYNVLMNEVLNLEKDVETAVSELEIAINEMLANE